MTYWLRGRFGLSRLDMEVGHHGLKAFFVFSELFDKHKHNRDVPLINLEFSVHMVFLINVYIQNRKKIRAQIRAGCSTTQKTNISLV